jgi:glycosyltransferase involved in cell wall biosynthesis
MLEKITPLILTYNEAPNIDRTLKKLTWAKRIVVIDSYSDDATLDIISNYPQVEVFQRKFDTHAKQCNFGIQQVKTDWVLSLDADYLLSDQLIMEITNLSISSDINYYFAPFKYCIFGMPLKSSILPPRAVLFKRQTSYYIDDGHAHLLQAEGKSKLLKNYIYHDDRKPLSRWLWSQDRYIQLEVQKLKNTPDRELGIADRLRKMKLIAPFLIFFYCLFIKGCILDGWYGWFYALQRLYAELLLSLRLIEADLQKEAPILN